jgi:RNA polymerase sigma-70 factor (ECF subfamily)
MLLHVGNVSIDFRALFVLRAVEQFSVQETAELLDIKPETVKTRLFSAKRLQRKQIKATLSMAGMRVYEDGGVHYDAIVRDVVLRIQKLVAK